MESALRILVGVDGSDDGHHAAEWAAAFASRTGAQVVVVHAISRVGEWMLSMAQIDFQKVEHEHGAMLHGEWTQPFRSADVPYETVLASGDPIKELLAVADARDVDLIVIGKTGFSAAGELLGGTAAKLAHRTTRPLVLVPASTSM
jgi:nucleotide-binding universal stress UspA family protein